MLQLSLIRVYLIIYTFLNDIASLFKLKNVGIWYLMLCHLVGPVQSATTNAHGSILYNFASYLHIIAIMEVME